LTKRDKLWRSNQTKEKVGGIWNSRVNCPWKANRRQGFLGRLKLIFSMMLKVVFFLDTFTNGKFMPCI
jgi:hypothetical protein